MATRFIETASSPSSSAVSIARARRSRRGVSPAAGPSSSARSDAPRAAIPAAIVDRSRPSAYSNAVMRTPYAERVQRSDMTQTGDRGDRPREVLRRRAGAATASTCACRAGTVFALLGPTARARPRPSGSSPRSRAPDGGTATRGRPRRRAPSAASVRRAISLTGQYAAVDELQTGEENLRMMGRLAGLVAAPRPARRARRAARALRPRRRRRPPGRHLLGRHAPPARPRGEPRRAARRCCSSTSRRRASTRAAGRRCGRSSRELVGGGVTVFLTTQYLEEADGSPTASRSSTAGGSSREGTAAELKRGIAGPAARPDAGGPERVRGRRGAARRARARPATPARCVLGVAHRRQRRGRARAARRDRPRRRRGRVVRDPRRDARRRLPRPHRPHDPEGALPCLTR